MASLVLNGRRIEADVGETLVDAAAAASIYLPHDCCTGQCDTCRVTVVEGSLDEAGTRRRDSVLGCLARVTADVSVVFDELPEPVSVRGRIRSIRGLSGDILEVVLRLDRPLAFRLGQYVSVAFLGFPDRSFSPTLGDAGERDDGELVLHVRREAGGLVSSRLGVDIQEGHPVRVRGAFGRAFLRPSKGRLIFVSSGTGWAPIFGLACEALTSQSREVRVVAAARDPGNLYMRPGAQFLRRLGAKSVILTCSGLQDPLDDVRVGRPTAHLPDLSPDDLVYACGSVAMVKAVQDRADAAGATCYADPFLPSSAKLSLMNRLEQIWLRVRPPAVWADAAE